MKPYELIDHTSDIGIKITAKSLKELFASAAFAMFDIAADLEGIKPSSEIAVAVEAETLDELLVNWLDELLYNLCTKNIILSEFDIIEMNDRSLKATARGRLIGENKNRLKTEIKAITYHELKVEEKDGTYSAQIIFDV